MNKFLKNKKGATTLEFGYVAVPLVMLTVGVIEFAIILFINSSLESGVIEASRYAITGQTTPGVTREQKVLDILNERGFGLVTIEPDDVQTLIYDNFASVGQPEPFTDANSNGSFDTGEDFVDVNGNGVWDPDMGVPGLGGAGDIVVYKVDYEWGMLTGLIKQFTGDLTFTSGVAVRNEPF